MLAISETQILGQDLATEAKRGSGTACVICKALISPLGVSASVLPSIQPYSIVQETSRPPHPKPRRLLSFPLQYTPTLSLSLSLPPPLTHADATGGYQPYLCRAGSCTRALGCGLGSESGAVPGGLPSFLQPRAAKHLTAWNDHPGREAFRSQPGLSRPAHRMGKLSECFSLHSWR
jgi:hypothetical protein